jgi:hypothetical protein
MVAAGWKELMQEKTMFLLDLHCSAIKGKDITVELMDSNKIAFIEDLRQNGSDPMNKMPGNEVTCGYRAAIFTVPCASILDGYEKKRYAYVYGVGVENGQLIAIWEEDKLIDGDPTMKRLKIEDALIRQQKNARDAAGQMMQAACASPDEINGDVIKHVMRTNHAILAGMDANWPITSFMFESIVGINSSGRFNELMVKCLPTMVKMISPQDSLMKLNELQSSRVMKVMGYGFQAQLAAMKQCVDQIVNKTRAEVPCDGSSAMKSACTRLSLWLSCDGADGTKIYGKHAAEKMHQDLMALDDSQITLEMLTDLNTFSWLLSSAAHENLMRQKHRLIGNHAIVPMEDQRASTSAGNLSLVMQYAS